MSARSIGFCLSCFRCSFIEYMECAGTKDWFWEQMLKKFQSIFVLGNFKEQITIVSCKLKLYHPHMDSLLTIKFN